MALSRYATTAIWGPLSGAKRTLQVSAVAAANDPKRT
jgi:hypothetical protein